ncbi:putative translation factor sui1 [Cucumis melo var. makuwa]|uniref:Translation factor sui1 n=1 Tax=Cucumis melo var. makuwa TaxID=1194695 RepID=A0A5D3C578_CUCMM|nr:putative translation factor sui1 [Cucumis melo var. makuwa]TYK07093.1 putative translation factor sui1 [Cucumis melo var. makuwa]
MWFQLFGPVMFCSFEQLNLRAHSFCWLPVFYSGQPSFMSEFNVQIPSAFDPFADANAEDSGAGAKEYVHVRIQQRNGRKSLTTVQGLKKEFSYNKILKDLKKEFCCNGTVVQDPELGQDIRTAYMHVLFFLCSLFWNIQQYAIPINYIVCNGCPAGYTTSGRPKKECVYIPCAGWYCEEGKHQDSRFLKTIKFVFTAAYN